MTEFVSESDPRLHNTLSCRDLSTEHAALGPGETHTHTHRVPDVVCDAVDVSVVVDVADVMVAGGPQRETDGI